MSRLEGTRRDAVALTLLLALAAPCGACGRTPQVADSPADSQASDAGASEEQSTVPGVDAQTSGDDLPEAESVDSTLMAPYGTNILGVTDAGVQIYWKRPEGAVGYEVARSYQIDGPYRVIARLGKGSFSYQDNSFDQDARTVFFKVRMLAKQDGSYVASPWSETIEATYEDGISLSRTTWYLPSGDAYLLEACHGWTSAHDVEWSSSDESVARVDQNGLVEAVSAGTAEITCASDELGIAATATFVIDREEASMLDNATPRYEQADDGSWVNPEAGEQRDAVLMMAGDLMCMRPQQNAQYTEEDGYVFNESFDYVKPALKTCDLAIGNLETMLASAYAYNRESGYLNGKPVCNAPARYLDALRYAGFDVLTMANNHNADTGLRGIPMTLEQVDRYQFPRTGLFASSDEDRTLLMDVNGIKVGIVAYVDETCSFNGQDGDWTQEQRDVLLNYYSPERAAADIKRLRERGAEYLISYVHWGVKNHYEPGEGQERTAHELADLGIDYIVGSHPHLVQRFETLVASDGRKVPCMYSLGDFNSNIHQVAGNLDSVLLRIRLHRTNRGRIVLAENAYIPCHIYRAYGSKHYVSMPLDSELNGGADTPGAEQFKERIATQVGNELREYRP